MSAPLPDLCVGPHCPIRDVITTINRNAKGIALVTDDERRLLGTITDGDVRRALMENVSLDSPVSHSSRVRWSATFVR